MDWQRRLELEVAVAAAPNMRGVLERLREGQMADVSRESAGPAHRS